MLHLFRFWGGQPPLWHVVRTRIFRIETVAMFIRDGAGSALRHGFGMLGSRTTRQAEQPNAKLSGSHRGDHARQIFNLLAAVGQAVTTGLVYLVGLDETITSNTTATAPIVPADYAFVIWGLIYGATIAYAIYQARPTQRTNPLLRRIGWWTAPAFVGTSLWLIAAVNNWYWTTVVIFFGILAALVGAFGELIRHGAPWTMRERLLLALPISVYLGWASVATVANTATALTASGYAELGLGVQPWTVIMLVLAGAIGTTITRLSHGNVPYALTVIWALLGVVVRNAEPAPVIALTAGGMAAVLGLTLLWEQRRR